MNSTKKISLGHITILVPSVRRACDYLKQFNLNIGEEDVFEAEGTKEVYVEGSRANSLLLVEPIAPGPYQNALLKRGPGLHHLAVDVLELEAFLISIAGSGWLLHPISIKTIKQSKTAWLARPGFPGLIEVQEKKKLNDGALFIEKVNLKLDKSHANLLSEIGLGTIVENGDVSKLFWDGESLNLTDLWD